WGNRYVAYHGGRSNDPPLVLEAHTDHPGFHVESCDGGQARLAYLGKPPAADLTGSPLLAFNERDETSRRLTVTSTRDAP
ncbi:hypothetical protein, partial [Tritonibacter sp. SIMBA_163]|uniref:hypothetical protein n=1 Tax=Tritonibacter sp. SIMBA_163 TaxID=3080868 RepID=UPI00397F0A3C